MSEEKSRVLVINPGSTSTKFGIYTHNGPEWIRTIRHGDEEVERFAGRPMIARLAYRAGLVAAELENAGYKADQIAATVGRGGLLPPMPCGTYLVDEAIVEELTSARQGEHASNLGALLALEFARKAGVKAYIVDPVTVDEWQPCARISGSPLIARKAMGHVLNTKAVARRYAREVGRPYEDLRLIVAHMGSGITVSAHRGGRMVDNNTIGEGPFGPDRTGNLPEIDLVRLCFSGQMAERELDRHIFGDGGFYAYLGTRNLQEVEQRIVDGDAKASLIFEAMVYQIAKEGGAMATVLEGKVDAILLTGGMAFSERAVARLRTHLSWIAPIQVYPGEDELQALAEGVFRVLNGEESVKMLDEEILATCEEYVDRKPQIVGID